MPIAKRMRSILVMVIRVIPTGAFNAKEWAKKLQNFYFSWVYYKI